MAVSGSVCIRPPSEKVRDVAMHYESSGLQKPLAECAAKEIGNLGEELASLYLDSKGYGIRARNWRCTFGEVDIVAEDGDTLVLVEVKTRLSTTGCDEVAPELAVGYRKRNTYRKLALFYLSRHVRFSSVRFDVVAVRLVNDHDALLRHHVGAYEWDD